MQASCKFCQYYAKTDDASGECHKSPPQVFFTGGDGTLSAWPKTSSDKFCGEFELRADIDPNLADADDFGSGERVEIISTKQTGTVIADADTPGIFRVAIDDVGIEEVPANKLKPTNE